MEKQIEEMAQCLCGWNRGTLCILDDKDCDLQCTYGKLANKLTAKGYRKASDVAREIIEDLTRMVFSKIPNKLLLISGGRDFTDGIIDGKREAYFDMLNYLAELKKKHESEGGE